MNPTELPTSESSDSLRPRVLYLTHRVPYPPDKGDRIRNYHVLRELARQARVWLVALADEPVTAAQVAQLESLCERVAIVPVHPRLRWLRAFRSALFGGSLTNGAFHEPALQRQVNVWSREVRWSAALVSASSLAPYLQSDPLRAVPGFVDLVDVDSQKWFDYAQAKRGPKRWLYRFEGLRVRRFEQSLVDWACAITLVSAAETALFNGFTRPESALTATNGVDLHYFQPQPEVPERRVCTFVGAMDYFPNVDAAVWFARSIWPGIHRRHPDAEFHIVGRNPTPPVQKLGAEPGVRVIGSVPDVRPHVASAMISVAPIRVARGLQNKVIEAMAMGKPTVAAPAAVAALLAQPGHDYLCPKSETEWVQLVGDLFDSPERRAELGRAGRVYVETHHRWDRCLRPLLDRVADPTASSNRTGIPNPNLQETSS